MTFPARFGLLDRLRRWVWRIRALGRQGLKVGDAFPDFSLAGLDGRRHRLSDADPADWTVLWFTNLCEDCRSRIPALEELRREGGARFRIMAVSLLGVSEEEPRRAADSCGFPILMDPEDIVDRGLGLKHPPGTCPIHNLFILDGNRKIIFRHHLSALSSAEFRNVWMDLTTVGR